MRLLITLCLMLSAVSCSTLHRHQLGEVDSRIVRSGLRFEILVSQLGIDVQEATGIAKAVARSQRAKDNIGAAGDIIAAFQMGPRTGNPVFDEAFADNLSDAILKECPNGAVSGLAVSRETAKYPVVSGEIVRVVGYCYQRREG